MSENEKWRLRFSGHRQYMRMLVVLGMAVGQINGVIIVSRMTFIDSIPPQDIVRFCQRWQVRELALFGSALRPDFEPESDVDVLISFHKAADWGLFDHVQMRFDLEAIFQRKVDLVTRRALEQTRNELLRDSILKTATVICDRSHLGF